MAEKATRSDKYAESAELKSDVRGLMNELIRTTTRLENLDGSVKVLVEKFDGVATKLAGQQTLIELQSAEIKVLKEAKATLDREVIDLWAKNSKQDQFIYAATGGLTVFAAVAPFILKLVGVIQ